MNIKISPFSEQFGLTISAREDISILELDKNEIINYFKSSGLLLFRGFDLNREKFKEFTESLSTNFISWAGGSYVREMINGDKTLLSVTAGKQNFALPFHGEMYYRKNKPTLLWFYCVTPALQDGETIVCDGIQVYKNLSGYAQKLFENKRLKYISYFTNGEWQKIYQTDDLEVVKQDCRDNGIHFTVNEDQSITTEYVCSAIIKSRCGQHQVFINSILPLIELELSGGKHKLVRLEDGSNIPNDIIREIKEVTDKLTHLIVWQKHDILMIDNTRLLHGRNSFSDNQRDICLRLCDAAFP